MDCLDYFSKNELAASVWKSKYQLKRDGLPMEKNPAEMHAREANEFARIEALYPHPLSKEQIYAYLQWFGQILPQGSVMSQLGNPYQIGSLSNCIVLPELHDSYGGIMYADQQLVQLMKRRCGVGLDISPLRPSGMLVSNAAQSSTGGVSFMHRFSNTTREVAQDGRRGALMISVDCRYPDLPTFAIIKNDLSKVTGANISIKMRDDFMQAVEAGETYQLRWPVDASIEDAKFVAEVNAKELWNTIATSARNFAEPGLIFWDRQHWYSPSSVYVEFRNISTNPCSEIAMGNDSCRLIAGNLAGSIINPFTKDAYFDYAHYSKTTYDGIRLMDDLVDLELEAIDRILTKVEEDPEPQFIKQVELDTWNQLRESGERGRRTGYGFTALGDTLAMLGMHYDSREALMEVRRIMQTKMASELQSTIDMAEQRGPFPAWDKDLEFKLSSDERTIFYMIRKEFPTLFERMMQVGRRNISWSTVAPVGSLSLLACLGHTNKRSYFSTTSGIEPVFNVKPNTLWHVRRKKINPSDKDVIVDFTDDMGDKWQEFRVFHEGFQMWADINFPELSLQEMPEEDLSLLVGYSPYGGSGSSEISWQKRIEMQAIVQHYTTHSISSTINLPSTATVQEVSEIYFEAWRRGLKGITVYRDGSRSGVLVSDNSKKAENKFEYHNAPKRPKELPAETYQVTVKGVKWTVIIGLYDKNPYEVFAVPRTESALQSGRIIKKGKGHYDFVGDNGIVVPDFTSAMVDEEEALTRLISTALRHGSSIDFIVEQLNKTHGTVVSFSKAISRILSRYAKQISEKKYTCQACGSENVRFEEGCHKCADCGSSRCG
jgi:ribonucleoside-diphosphate reductase alpha chain